MLAGEGADLVGRDADAAPGVVLPGVRREAVQLAPQNAAGLENPPRLTEIAEDDVAARDVLEDRVGVDEVELGVGEQAEVGAGAVVRVRVGRVGEPRAREADHLVGYVDAVDLAEIAAEGAQEAARTAADLERGVAAGKALKIGDQPLDEVGGGGEELVVVLLAAAEGDVVIGVLGGALVPVRAHAVENSGIVHACDFP